MIAAGPFALVVAALFTGAAFYINFAEHPARMGLDDRAALAQWKPAYHRGFIMQASLAVIGFLCAVAAWLQDSNVWWLFGGLVLLANWPFTLFGIMPTNKKLEATAPDAAGSASRALLGTWNKLHAVRTGLGAVATVILLCQLI